MYTVHYIEIGGPVSMGQRTTEILIQFWIFAASPLKRPWIYLVGPTVDERNPPSSWKQQSHFKGHRWAKSIQHWNLHMKIMQRLESKDSLTFFITTFHCWTKVSCSTIHFFGVSTRDRSSSKFLMRRKSMTPTPRGNKALKNGLLTTMIPLKRPYLLRGWHWGGGGYP